MRLTITAKLTDEEGKEGNCEWLKDKFGVSWQVVPTILPSLKIRAHDADPYEKCKIRY